MNKTMLLLFAATLATSASAAPIDGTWVADASTAQLSAKPKMRLLNNGIYRCSTCVPAYSVAADGKWHTMKGDPYVDESMVRVVDAHTVVMEDRQHGKSLGSSTGTISPNGKSIRWQWKNIAANGTVTTGESMDERIAAGPKGAHLLSGSWRSGKIGKMDAAALTIMFKEEAGMLHMSTPTGVGYDAKLGGPAVAVRGDMGGGMVAVRKTGAGAYAETSTRKGKRVGMMTFKVVNPTTMTVVSTSTESGRTTRYTAHKK